MSRAKATLLPAALSAALAAAGWPGTAAARPGEVIARFPFGGLAPQDIAWDGSTYYVTSFLDTKIRRFKADMTPLPPLRSPFDTALGLTGITFDGNQGPRLWLVEPISREIRAIDLSGNPTGDLIRPQFEPVVNPGSQPTPRGVAFDAQGNFGGGSLYVYESVGSLIYELDLDGVPIRKFSHPDDPDGFPGQGATAPGSDVDLAREGGELRAIYVTGGRGTIDSIRRLNPDGSYSGFSVPLSEAGGRVSGFLRKDFTTAGGKTVSPAIIALVESSAEIVVLDGSEPTISEIFNLSCTVLGGTATIQWESGSRYDRVELYRDGVLLQTFSDGRTQALDQGLGQGVYRYRLRASLGPDSVESEECAVVVGGGAVLRNIPYEGPQPVDLAVSPEGSLYVSDYVERTVHVYNEELEPQTVLDLSFMTEDDRLTGIAYNPAEKSLFLYNSETNIIVETDLGGSPRNFTPVALPNDPLDRRDKPVVGGMTFDPEGGPGGEGLFWLTELTREMVYAVDLKGQVVSGFPHPVSVESPFPPRSAVFNFMGGISDIPALGFGFLDLTSGSVFERELKRIIRVDTRSGAPVKGAELSLAGQKLVAPGFYLGIQHALKSDGRPTLFMTVAAGRSSRILEIDPTLPDPRPITSLSARVVDRGNEVALEFCANDSYQRIEVERDGQPLAALLPGQFTQGRMEYRDRDVPAGFHRYALRGIKGPQLISPVTTELQVGPGAILDRGFAHPVTSPIQMSRDPVDGTFLLASNSPGQARSLFRFRTDRTFDSELKEVVADPTHPLDDQWEVATMAVRPDGQGGGVLHVIAWAKPTEIGEGPDTFPMFLLTREGSYLGQRTIRPPRPDNGSIIYPTGLAWHPDLQVFYYLERNSSTLVRMDQEGRTLALIPHPAPPAQDYVFNLGLSIDPENGAILLTSAGPEDHRITRVLQLTGQGRLTGLLIPLAESPMDPLTGIAIDGPDLLVTGYGAAAEILRVQAFQPIPPPGQLSCQARGRGVLLTWSAPVAYDAVVVSRDGLEIATLPGSAQSAGDTPPDRNGYHVYSVAGRIAGRTGKNRFCELQPLPLGFIRGDADSSGTVELTDAILVLNYLFLAGPAPACDDAADADDSGSISITDPIRILGRLFLGDGELPPPYPEAGEDPTPDGLGCS